MRYSNVVDIRNLTMGELNKAMYDQNNVSLILNTALHEVGMSSRWYSCARLIMQAVDSLLKHEDCGVYILQKAAGMAIDVKCHLGFEMYAVTGNDERILNKFKETQTDTELAEFRIPGIVETLFRVHVRYAARSLGVCRDYLKRYETAWEAWIRLILDTESFRNDVRYCYMLSKAYDNKIPEAFVESGKSPARLKGSVVYARDVQKDSVIETKNGIRYYVHDRVTDDDGVRLYCVMDTRETAKDGLLLKTKNGASTEEGWLYCGDNEVVLIGLNNEVAVMNERIVPNDIRRGDTVSIYGSGHVMIKEHSNNTFEFEGAGGEPIKMKKEDVIYNDNIVVISSLKVPAKIEKEFVVYRNGYVELRPDDVISYSYSETHPIHEGQVVFSASHGAYGVVNGHVFLPLCMLHNIKRIK